jgi:hypothetical protein
VRAVSVVIVRRNSPNVAAREIVESRDAVVEVSARLDARIDHRDADAIASHRDRRRRGKRRAADRIGQTRIGFDEH